jgi:hypothetical protein
LSLAPSRSRSSIGHLYQAHHPLGGGGHKPVKQVPSGGRATTGECMRKISNISSSTICQNLPQHIFWTPCPEISHHLSPKAILRQMSSQGIQRLSKALDFQCLTTLSAFTAPHVPALSAEVARRAEGGVERLEVPDWCPTGVREWVDCGHGNMERPWKRIAATAVAVRPTVRQCCTSSPRFTEMQKPEPL